MGSALSFVAPAIYGGFKGFDDANTDRRAEDTHRQNTDIRNSQIESERVNAPLRTRALELGIKNAESAEAENAASAPLRQQALETQVETGNLNLKNIKEAGSRDEKLRFMQQKFKDVVPSIVQKNWSGVTDYINALNDNDGQWTHTSTKHKDGAEVVTFKNEDGTVLEFDSKKPSKFLGVDIPPGDIGRQVYTAVSMFNKPENIDAMLNAQEERRAKAKDETTKNRGTVGKMIDDLASYGFDKDKIRALVERSINGKDASGDEKTEKEIRLELEKAQATSGAYMSPQEREDNMNRALARVMGKPMPPSVPKPLPKDKKGKVDKKAIIDGETYSIGGKNYKADKSTGKFIPIQ